MSKQLIINRVLPACVHLGPITYVIDVKPRGTRLTRLTSALRGWRQTHNCPVTHTETNQAATVGDTHVHTDYYTNIRVFSILYYWSSTLVIVGMLNVWNFRRVVRLCDTDSKNCSHSAENRIAIWQSLHVENVLVHSWAEFTTKVGFMAIFYIMEQWTSLTNFFFLLQRNWKPFNCRYMNIYITFYIRGIYLFRENESLWLMSI